LKNSQRKLKFRIFTSVLILLSLTNFFTLLANGDYNIKEGDFFKFDIILLRKTDGSRQVIHFGTLTIQENESLKLEISYLKLPHIKFKITINGFSEETALLSNIIVQNRSWDKLTTEYSTMGYEIYEDSEIWGVRQNNATKLHIDFSKADGVLTKFYAFNQSDLINFLHIGEVDIIRIQTGINYKLFYMIFGVFPLGAAIYGLVIYKKNSNKKIALYEAKYKKE